MPSMLPFLFVLCEETRRQLDDQTFFHIIHNRGYQPLSIYAPLYAPSAADVTASNLWPNAAHFASKLSYAEMQPKRHRHVANWRWPLRQG